MDIETLKKLHQLKELGIIDEKEFDQQKQKIINPDVEQIKKQYSPISGGAIGCLILVAIGTFGLPLLLYLIFLLAVSNA